MCKYPSFTSLLKELNTIISLNDFFILEYLILTNYKKNVV